MNIAINRDIYFQLVETTDKLECIISLEHFRIHYKNILYSFSIVELCLLIWQDANRLKRLNKVLLLLLQLGRQWAIIFLSQNGIANSTNCTFVWYLIKCY